MGVWSEDRRSRTVQSCLRKRASGWEVARVRSIALERSLAALIPRGKRVGEPSFSARVPG
jgi:hypothetical protein